MGNWNSIPDIQEREVKNLVQETGFSVSKIEYLWERFNALDRGKKGYLVKDDFEQIHELQRNYLADRIIDSFFKERQRMGEPGVNSIDTESAEAGVNFREFVRVLAVMKPLNGNAKKNKLNTREDKIKFIYKMFDVNDDGKISQEEMFSVLTEMIGEDVTHEQLESIAIRMVQEADGNDDKSISFEEFCEVIKALDVETKVSISSLG